MSDIELVEDDFFGAPQTDGFTIDSREKAEWALNKIAQKDARIAESERIAEQLIARIRARVADITRSDRESRERLVQMLHPWGAVEIAIAKAGKARSVKLIGGTIGFRQSPARLEVTDEAAAIAALPAECVRVKKEVDKTAVKELIEKSGEVPPGVALVPGEVTFYVKAEPLSASKKEIPNG
jgi:phage host-nuclease inhibitor protein Gam